VLGTVSWAYRAWGSTAPVTRTLSDGDRLDLRDRTLEVLHRPGHSPTDTLFWDEQHRILFAADHLLKRISSNPLITRPPGVDPADAAGRSRPQVLVTYLDSLARTRELPAEVVLPGHGEPIGNHAELIDERFRMHERRAEKVFELIAECPRSAYEIGQAMWGDVAVTQAYLTLSEVLGHVDLLLNAGRVREIEDDGRAIFEVGG
jgi:glyoxylase-like metal-dependent hydrolase (beta-lactamase superfamily II)